MRSVLSSQASLSQREREDTVVSVVSGMCMIVQVTEHVTERDGNAEWQRAAARAGGAMSNEPLGTIRCKQH